VKTVQIQRLAYAKICGLCCRLLGINSSLTILAKNKRRGF
jgi:hypothetical protein